MNKNNYIQKYSDLLLLFGFSVVILILLLCLNTFYWADDYIFLVELKKNGILENCIEGYFNWDGRFLALGAFFQAFFLKYLKVEIITLFWSICFLTSGVLIFDILKTELNLPKLKQRHKLLIAIVLCLVLWLGSYSHISETIYWGTGGVYSFDLLLGAIWIVFYLRFQQKEFSLKSKIAFAFFSIIVGASTQNLSIGLITLVLITILIDFLNREKKNLFLNGIIVLGLFLGLIFIVSAPGNFVRMDNIENMNVSNMNILFLVKGFFWVLASYLKRAIVLCVLSLLGAVGLLFLIYPNSKIKFNIQYFIPNTKIKITVWLVNYKWLLVSLSTITPFIFMPQMASYRTTIYFLYFFQIFIFHFILKFCKEEYKIKKNNISYIPNLMFVLIFSFCTLFSIYNLRKGIVLKKVIIERENKLKKGINQIVEIELINPSLKSPCYNFSDFTLNNSDFIRVGQEEYFGVKKIIVKKNSTKK